MMRRLPRGIIRAVAGIVESAGTEPFRSAVSEASEVIGADISSEQVRLHMIKAVQLNLINRREWPFERLQQRYGLPCEISYFKRQKYNYITEVAARCGLIER